MAPSEPTSHTAERRNFLLISATLALLYPIFRFLGYSMPRKPRTISVTASLGSGGFHLGPDYILFDNGEQTWALSRRCTHLGCTINFHEKEQVLECPCHQSRFGRDGLVLHGPATRPLSRYPVKKLKDDGGYLVTL